MHVDESKKFDKRNIERNIKDGIITQKDYESYLARLEDASDKIFSHEEDMADSEEFESSLEDGFHSRRKSRKKSKVK